MDDATMRTLLQTSTTIAVVGMSDRPDRDSHQIGAYLLRQGYRVVPVNPSVPSVLGQTCYPSLREVPSEVRIDIVDVFRKSDAVPGVVEDALSRSPPPRAVWLQLGVKDDASGARLQAHGVDFVQNSCIMVRHRQLLHT